MMDSVSHSFGATVDEQKDNVTTLIFLFIPLQAKIIKFLSNSLNM